MILEVLQPVDLVLLDQFQSKPPHIFGNKVKVHRPAELPDLKDTQIAIITVAEESLASVSLPDFSEVRYALYHLFCGNWDVEIADLGTLPAAGDLEETEAQVAELCEYLLKKGITPLVLGGTQNILYGIYRAFDNVKKGVYMIAADSKFDFSTSEEIVSSRTYMSRIITEKPLNLFNLVNLGYQTYYVAQEEIDLMNRMLFDAHRLGAITPDISSTEHLIRGADIMSIDVFGSVRALDLGFTNRGLPNGFTSKEFCALARYAGISTSILTFALLECPSGYLGSQLIAQAIWYFIEGFNYREVEIPSIDNPLYEKHTVSLDYINVSFYKSLKTSRWWIEFSDLPGYNAPMLFPCSHKDYLQACRNSLPETWESIYNKLVQ